MIIDKSDKTIVSTGIQSEAFFNVKQENLSHLLGILRNQLYSDKIQAVIREYCTNAMDANIDAGNDSTPIQVSLPNSFSPIFKVRDFGKGLSEEQIYNIYISFGDSSKRNTNTQTGCLGLGSKSAFAYVDNFTLTSYHDGLKSVYSAYIDESEIGKITRLTCEPSDEPTGIEVAIAVKSGDYRQFSDKCFDVLRWFDPKPTINNDTSLHNRIANSDANPILASDKWSIIKSTDTWMRNNLKVVMGNVAYPVSLDALGIGTVYRDYIHSFRYMDIIIKAPIGAVKNNASREALDYNPKTKNWLFNALADFKDEVGAELSKQMDSAQTMWDALRMYRDLSDKVGHRNVLQYRGVKIDSPFLVLPKYVKARKVEKNRNNKYKWEECRQILPANNVRVFVDNGSIKRNELFGRIESYGDLTEQTYLLQFADKFQADEFFAQEMLQGCPWIDLNDASYVKPARKSAGVKSVYSEAYEFVGGRHYRNADHWKPCQIDIANGEGIYVVISHYVPVSSSMTIGAIESLRGQLILCNLNVPIYGVRGKTQLTLGQGWKSLESYRRELFDELTTKHGLKQCWDVQTAFIDPVLRDFAGYRYENFEFPQAIKSVVDAIEYTNKLYFDNEMHLAQHIFDTLRVDYQSGLQPMIQQVFETYPMLQFVGKTFKQSDAEKVMEYINLVG